MSVQLRQAEMISRQKASFFSVFLTLSWDVPYVHRVQRVQGARKKIEIRKTKQKWNILVPFMSGKCKRIARHLLVLLWFSWRCKFAEVFTKSTTSKENKANNDLFTFWIRGLFTSAKLHDKLLWHIGGVECVYTSQLNGTGHCEWLATTHATHFIARYYCE